MAGLVWPGVVRRHCAQPLAQRYFRSKEVPGEACAIGEREKARTYGGACLAIAFESYGRLGTLSARNLRAFVAARAAAGVCSPHAARRWRTQLERSLLAAEADTWLRSLNAALPHWHAPALRGGAGDAGGPADGDPDHQHELDLSGARSA